MKQSKKLLTNKILFSGLLILIQLIIVFVAFLTIHRSSRFFVYLFKLISVLAALYIINKDDASAYKITWLVLIAAVPLVGSEPLNIPRRKLMYSSWTARSVEASRIKTSHSSIITTNF